MLKNIIEAATGLCCEVDETDESAVVFAPRPFKDEPEYFLLIEKRGDKLLLTVEGGVMLHHGRCAKVVKEISAIVRGSDLDFTNDAIELRCDVDELAPAVKKFLATMSALAAHEQEFNEMWWQSWQESKAIAPK